MPQACRVTRNADTRDPLRQLLGEQRQVVAREQALASGLSPKALRHRLRPDGPWQVLLPGVYVATTGPVTANQRDVAAVLHAGPHSVITGRAALYRHGLQAKPPAVIDVLVPVSVRRSSSAFIRVHHSQRMPERFCVTGPVRFALPARAVGDTVRWLTTLGDVRAVVGAAVQRRACTLALLQAELAEGPGPGSGLFRAALAEVADGVRSAAEGDFRGLVKNARLPAPMFNARLFAGPEFLATVDAWWPTAGVAAEIDSREWHFAPADWENTVDRHTRLSARGINVLHFTPAQVRRDPRTVVEHIRSALANSPGAPAGIRALPATA